MQTRKDNQKTWEAEGNKGHRVEDAEYYKFITRILRAFGRRGAKADATTLAAMLALRAELDAAIETTVVGMKSNGYSWANIAEATGTTRQAACMRWSAAVADAAESTSTINPSL